ncbi:MAG: hypothetical protein AAGF94_10390 [Pseudomonadota bacterium]
MISHSAYWTFIRSASNRQKEDGKLLNGQKFQPKYRYDWPEHKN